MLEAIFQAALDMLNSGINPADIVNTLVSGGITNENATEIVCYVVAIA